MLPLARPVESVDLHPIRKEVKMKAPIQFKLNNKSVNITLDGDRKLLWVLRTDLGITGPKYGCGEGLCGACTVLVNNEAVLSCQLPVKEVEGANVITIEGLANGDVLHPLQNAFVRHDAMQCGFCTSGMILKAYSLLEKKSNLSRDEIIQGMDENLCRCGAHGRIVEAIETALKEMKGGKR
jgi:carbon-monoxide dehydrogenase small subunit